jgi:hypothetical protein
LGGTLYGADFGQTARNLYAVNTTNGALSVVGSASVTYDDFGSTLTGGLFAVGSDDNPYSINATTGAATLVGPVGLKLIGQRALSNNSNTLYFADGVSADLYTIDTTSGTTTLLGDMGLGADEGMDALLAEGGILYGSGAPQNIFTLDPTTGHATQGPRSRSQANSSRMRLSASHPI